MKYPVAIFLVFTALSSLGQFYLDEVVQPEKVCLSSLEHIEGSSAVMGIINLNVDRRIPLLSWTKLEKEEIENLYALDNISGWNEFKTKVEHDYLDLGHNKEVNEKDFISERISKVTEAYATRIHQGGDFDVYLIQIDYLGALGKVIYLISVSQDCQSQVYTLCRSTGAFGIHYNRFAIVLNELKFHVYTDKSSHLNDGSIDFKIVEVEKQSGRIKIEVPD